VCVCVRERERGSQRIYSTINFGISGVGTPQKIVNLKSFETLGRKRERERERERERIAQHTKSQEIFATGSFVKRTHSTQV
jgi:hypothetical protein